MTYRGHVKNGKIVLDGVVDLPEGAAVSVRPVKRRPSAGKRRRKEPPTLYEQLKDFVGVVDDLPPKPTVGKGLLALAGKAKGLPRDAARNLDHYLYGLPKRK